MYQYHLSKPDCGPIAISVFLCESLTNHFIAIINLLRSNWHTGTKTVLLT